MAWTEIPLGDQHSQEMTIKYVRDNYLVCNMTGFNASFTIEELTADVSRPPGLRRMDYDGSGEYSWVHPNTRKILTGTKSGEHELVTPLYKPGEKIYVTKMVSAPTDTSGNSFTVGLAENSTVDIFVDENRAGRGWAPTGDGIPSGYKPKCIVFCEDGEEVSGQVLFKVGCEDTPEGSGSSGAKLTSEEIASAGGFNVSLFYGYTPDIPIDYTYSLSSLVGLDVEFGTLADLCGAPSPLSGFGSIAKWLTSGTPRPTSGYLVSDLYDATEPQPTLPVTKGLVDPVGHLGQVPQVVVNIPSGTKAKGVYVGDCAYTIPEVGESIGMVSGSDNTWATAETYYLLSNTINEKCFSCGTYYVKVKGSGDASGVITETGYLAPHPDCEKAELATPKSDVFYLNTGSSEEGFFSDLEKYNKSFQNIELEARNSWHPSNWGPSGVLMSGGLPSEWTGSSSNIIGFALGAALPGEALCTSGASLENLNEGGWVNLKMYSGPNGGNASGIKLLMGIDNEGGGYYTMIPAPGSIFMLKIPSDKAGAPGGVEVLPYTSGTYFQYSDWHGIDTNGETSIQASRFEDNNGSYKKGARILLKLQHVTGAYLPNGDEHGWDQQGSDNILEYVKVVSTGFCGNINYINGEKNYR